MNPKVFSAATIFVLGGILFCHAQTSSSRREQKISSAAEALRPKLVEQRRDFHQHPELSNREVRTARVIAERLRELGLDEIRTNVAHHGIVALLKGKKPGPVVAVRADFDALPITEVKDVPYKSQNPGVMHACGHDVHTTIELGVAEILSRMRDEIPGSIKFIFQPAEEGAPVGEEGGAALMIKEGAMENPKPLAIFGLHCASEKLVFAPGRRRRRRTCLTSSFGGKCRTRWRRRMAWTASWSRRNALPHCNRSRAGASIRSSRSS